MKQRKETRIESAFDVETIISFHHRVRMQDCPVRNPVRGHNGVVYDFWQLLFMEEGTYNCQIEDCLPGRMQGGQLLICEPRKIRYSFHHTDAVVGIINIRCSSPKLKQLKNRIFTLNSEEQNEVYRILELGQRIFQTLPEGDLYIGQQPLSGTADYQLQMLKNHIELLLIRLYAHFETGGILLQQERRNHYEAKFNIIKDYMKAHIQEPLTMADISRGTALSTSTVKRIFESQTDCGAMHYFLKLKMQEAKRLLREQELTVTEISEALGFSSIHYFSRIFKRFTGTSPTKYAKSQLTQGDEEVAGA